MTESDYQILKLTSVFYEDYPNPPYCEILKKEKRAYNCLLFQSHYDYFICIPYRSEIAHPYAFRFKRTRRAKQHRSGLDYTKIVIITKNEYIDNKDAMIDQDEFRQTIRNLEKIKGEALQFVEDYVKQMQGENKMSPQEFSRRYSYSTLKYFHRELKIL